MDKFEDILFYIAIGFSGFTLYKVYMANKAVPEGMCPINNYIEYIYISIGLAAVYFLVSFINKKKTVEDK
ncbi:MAG: hypothetical protein R6U59_00095 [Eubacteriales bacterium]